MSVRKSLIIFALASAGLSMAHAQSSTAFVGGEIGFVFPEAQSTLSRDQVRQDLQVFRAEPIAADGARFVGGEIGYVPEQHAFARVDGQWVCIDNIAHNAKPDATKSAAEQRLFLQQYPA